jgi:hypothetical protein
VKVLVNPSDFGVKHKVPTNPSIPAASGMRKVPSLLATSGARKDALINPFLVALFEDTGGLYNYNDVSKSLHMQGLIIAKI